MDLNVEKTKVMHAEEQQEIPALTTDQIKSVEEGYSYKNECECCGKKFKTEGDENTPHHLSAPARTHR